MPNEEKMTIDERYKYLRIKQKPYLQAKRKERSRMLDEMEQVTGLERKTLIRHMNGRIERRARRRQRGNSYGAALDDALRVIAESHDYICAERLKPNLVSMAQHLAAHGELHLSPVLLEQLECVSVSTIRRRLQKFARLETWRLPRRRKPRPAHPLLRDVPMGRIPWDEQEPGHFEVDLVHHCGPSASGDYVHTVQLVDVATGWCEQVAVLGRSQRVMQDAFRRILARLPFPVREIHPDNGKEFFNDHLLRFWQEAVKGVRLSRSRPFHKNDNRFVEQKNGSQVRYYLGHERLDTVAQTLMLNRIYEKSWVYHNLFQPVLRMSEKTVTADSPQPGRVQRRFDLARTPFERLCATAAISPQRREELQRLREQTNPRRLREEIYQLLDELFTLPGATPGITENVLDTLHIPIPT
ncbi:MAG: transposase family protein [Thermoplasmatales archaeon]|nr:transposase family protein [Thermoplasmatales archaeon]